MSSRSRCGLRGMTSREPIATTNLDKTSETEPLPWKRARDLLDAGALAEAASFLGTVRPDGRPHSARIGAAWYDSNVYFQTGQQTRKARNLEVNPACTLSTSLTGIDLVFEGLAERITDGPTLEAVAAVWREGGWAAEVSRDGIVAPYNAPGTGPPPWQVYRVAAQTVFGVATAEPFAATRANGVTLAVEHFGDAAAPLVLLIGGPTMLSWPDALCEALASGGRHVVRYDLRDSGASTTVSSKAPAYTLRDLAADAAALACELDDRPGAPGGHRRERDGRPVRRAR